MKNHVCVLLLLILLVLTSCGYRQNSPITSDGSVTVESSDTVTAVPSEAPPVSDETAMRIETVPYPNPQTVSAYDALNEDQQMAYDAIGDALCKALDGSFSVGETYPLKRRILWYDYRQALRIFDANYTALSTILGVFFSQDSLGTQDHVDGILFYDNGFASDFLNREYPALCEAADSILGSLTYDGTDSGKAFAIAQWLVDNVVYPSDYKVRSSDTWLISAEGPILRKEAVCDGYAKAYDFLCKRAGLETIYVMSRKQNHAWNMICVDDAWYHIDTTWMNSRDYHKYFMMSEKECYADHEKAEYYCITRTLESIIPEAPHCSPYGCLVFDTADGAFDYLRDHELTDELRFYFTSPVEKDKFLTYDKKYVSTTDSFLSVRSLCDEIAVVSSIYYF